MPILMLYAILHSPFIAMDAMLDDVFGSQSAAADRPAVDEEPDMFAIASSAHARVSVDKETF